MKKIIHRALHDHVIESIGRQIISGELPAQKPLPSEINLCSQLGVSRTALREAFRVLAAKGLVEAKRRVGTLVTATSQWNYLDADVLRWQLGLHDTRRVISELYQLRQLLEPIAASLAAEHAKARDIAELKAAYADMVAAGDDGKLIIEPDLRFHRTIIAASGNRLFSSLSRAIGAALESTFALLTDAPGGHRSSMPAHKKILDAITNGDASKARLAMQDLVEQSWFDAKKLGKRSPSRNVAR